MDFDDQLVRYFGTTDLGTVPESALAAGRERLVVDFHLERDRGRRFAMWAVLHILAAAPDLDVAFADPADRDVARGFMDMFARSAEN